MVGRAGEVGGHVREVAARRVELRLAEHGGHAALLEAYITFHRVGIAEQLDVVGQVLHAGVPVPERAEDEGVVGRAHDVGVRARTLGGAHGLVVGADAKEGGEAAPLTAAKDGAEDGGGGSSRRCEQGGAVGGSDDGDGGAAEPNDGAGGVEEESDRVEVREAVADELEARASTRGVVHVLDVIGHEAVVGRVLAPPTHQVGELLGALRGVAPVSDKLEGARGGGKGGDCSGKGGGGACNGGGRASGGRGLVLHAARGDGGLGVLDAKAASLDVLGQRVDEVVVESGLLRGIDAGQDEAAELLRDAERAPAEELAGDGVALLQHASPHTAGDEVVRQRMDLVAQGGVDGARDAVQAAAGGVDLEEPVVLRQGARGLDVVEALGDASDEA